MTVIFILLGVIAIAAILMMASGKKQNKKQRDHLRGQKLATGDQVAEVTGARFSSCTNNRNAMRSAPTSNAHLMLPVAPSSTCHRRPATARNSAGRGLCWTNCHCWAAFQAL